MPGDPVTFRGPTRLEIILGLPKVTSGPDWVPNGCAQLGKPKETPIHTQMGNPNKGK